MDNTPKKLREIANAASVLARDYEHMTTTYRFIAMRDLVDRFNTMPALSHVAGVVVDEAPPAKGSPEFTAVPGYEQLIDVFKDAHDQAAIGKGKERHANDLPFHEQRMQQISTQLNSPYGMAYQVEKKMTEGLTFTDAKRREAELLGAIVYLAGIVVWLRNNEVGAE